MDYALNENEGLWLCLSFVPEVLDQGLAGCSTVVIVSSLKACMDMHILLCMQLEFHTLLRRVSFKLFNLKPGGSATYPCSERNQCFLRTGEIEATLIRGVLAGTLLENKHFRNCPKLYSFNICNLGLRHMVERTDSNMNFQGLTQD